VEALSPACDVVVIVDVLSFSTCVDMATAGGATVLPYRFRDDTAATYARECGALLAGANPRGYSLKPASLTAIEAGCRLVLPSPNGSTLSLATGTATTLAGCLRNRTAVARHAAASGGTVLVVPAGERWPHDGSLRPAFEDLCGAGAVVAALPPQLTRSPDALAAGAVFRAARRDLASRVAACASGREKSVHHDEADVALAVALDASDCVPVLEGPAYRALTPP
jgi:2-phosphosulfolactate phosphatase